MNKQEVQEFHAAMKLGAMKNALIATLFLTFIGIYVVAMVKVSLDIPGFVAKTLGD